MGLCQGSGPGCLMPYPCIPRRWYGSKSTVTSAGGVSAGTLSAMTLTSDPVWRQRQLPSAISAHTCARAVERHAFAAVQKHNIQGELGGPSEADRLQRFSFRS